MATYRQVDDYHLLDDSDCLETVIDSKTSPRPPTTGLLYFRLIEFEFNMSMNE